MTALKHREAFSDRLPNQVEVKNAEQLQAIIASQRDDNGAAQLAIKVAGDDVQSIVLAPALTESFLELLRLVSKGQGFRMIPLEADLTTQEAADLLNVSRPYLIKLLESGDVPFTKTGRHRRVKASDLLEYKRKRDATRSAALDALAAMDAEENLI